MTKAEAQKTVADLARSQVGYHEGENNYNKYAEDQRITQLYGWNVQNQPWCCTFVNWCFLNAFGDIGAKMTYGGSAACSAQADLYRRNNVFYTSRPEVGDQIFFYSNGGINHTGIVVEVNGSTIRTVEGNYSDKVSLCTYVIGNSVIAGYGRPKWSLVIQDHEKPYVVVINGQAVSSSSSGKNDEPEAAGKPATIDTKDSHAWSPPLLKYDPNNYYEACKLMQAALNVRSFDAGKADGYFGPKTVAAVNRAKRFWVLECDGTCDAALWAKLLTI